jgi:hypothetical protein
MDSNRPHIQPEDQFITMADHAPVLIWLSAPDRLRYFF